MTERELIYLRPYGPQFMTKPKQGPEVHEPECQHGYLSKSPSRGKCASPPKCSRRAPDCSVESNIFHFDRMPALPRGPFRCRYGERTNRPAWAELGSHVFPPIYRGTTTLNREIVSDKLGRHPLRSGRLLLEPILFNVDQIDVLSFECVRVPTFGRTLKFLGASEKSCF